MIPTETKLPKFHIKGMSASDGLLHNITCRVVYCGIHYASHKLSWQVVANDIVVASITSSHRTEADAIRAIQNHGR